jgi:hypothetical protein
MRRSLVTLTIGALLMSIPSLAAAQQSTVGLAGAMAATDLATADLAAAIAEKTASAEAVPMAPMVVKAPRPSGRSTLTALSVASAALQGLDGYTTMAALKRGAVEANPMMRGAVRNPGVFIAVKASMTAATIFAARKMWPTNKVAAIAVLAVSNGVMATVVAHNMSVLKQLK